MRYRKLDCRLWGDARFSELSAPTPNAQDLWIDLLLRGRDRAVPGVIAARVEVLAADRRWPVDETDRCLRELEAAGMVEVDRAAGVIWIPKKVGPRSSDQPRAPDNLRSWGGFDWSEIPECGLKRRAWEHARRYAEERGEKFLAVFELAVEEPPEPAAVLRRETPRDEPRPVETRRDAPRRIEPPRPVRTPRPLPLPPGPPPATHETHEDRIAAVFAAYTEVCVPGGFQAHARLTRDLRWSIHRVMEIAHGGERDREVHEIREYFEAAVEARRRSDWMRRRKLGLDWLLKSEERIRRVTEAAYDDEEAAQVEDPRAELEEAKRIAAELAARREVTA